MKRFIACDDFFELFPDASFGVIKAINVNNQDDKASNENDYFEMLRAAEKASLKYVPLEPISENTVVATWRDAYKRFKTKKGARCSIEALLKRVKQGQQIPSISPIVDIYNSISLKYGLPCGAEDIDTFVGDLRLTKADGTEEFFLIGSSENEPPYPGEIVYKDDAGAVCRCFNWRESKRTMVTENSKNVFLIVESIDSSRLEDFNNALCELDELVKKYLGADTERFVVNKDNREVYI